MINRSSYPIQNTSLASFIEKHRKQEFWIYLLTYIILTNSVKNSWPSNVNTSSTTASLSSTAAVSSTNTPYTQSHMMHAQQGRQASFNGMNNQPPMPLIGSCPPHSGANSSGYSMGQKHASFMQQQQQQHMGPPHHGLRPPLAPPLASQSQRGGGGGGGGYFNPVASPFMFGPGSVAGVGQAPPPLLAQSSLVAGPHMNHPLHGLNEHQTGGSGGNNNTTYYFPSANSNGYRNFWLTKQNQSYPPNSDLYLASTFFFQFFTIDWNLLF